MDRARSDLPAVSTSSTPGLVTRWGRAALFLVAFACMAGYGLSSQMPFRGDAHEIWEVSKHLYDAGRARSFVEYRGPFTFVFYNVLYVLSQALGVDGVAFVRTFNALLFAGIATWLVPGIFARLFARPISAAKTLLFAALMFWFFRGYFLHPQTDVPAFVFLLLAVNLATAGAGTSGRLWGCALGIGVLMACSIMMRFSYVLATPLVLYAWSRLAVRQGLGAPQVVGATVLAALVVAVLAYANAVHSSGTESLLARQLKGGLALQKVEWNAGDAEYPGHLYLRDRRGEAILEAEGIGADGAISPTAYLRLYLKYPADMAVLHLRHLFGGLDIAYHAVYVDDLHAGRIWRSLVNYNCFFLALVIVQAKIRSRVWAGHALPALLAMCVQSLAAVPFIGEVRFFMPVILTVLAVTVFNWELGVSQLRRRGLAMHAVVFVALCFISSASQFETVERVLLFSAP